MKTGIFVIYDKTNNSYSGMATFMTDAAAARNFIMEAGKMPTPQDFELWKIGDYELDASEVKGALITNTEMRKIDPKAYQPAEEEKEKAAKK